MVPMTRISGITDNCINTRNWEPYSQRYYEMLETRKALPVWRLKAEFLKVFKSNQVVLLAGETGSGKTSQIPQFILEAIEVEFPYNHRKMMIGCTQPCQMAAISMSQHVAMEMDVTVGEEVGYSIPFEDRCSAKTVLKYLTDGMLLREAMADPLLEQYKVIILDEAHERALATDVLFGLLKEVIKKRPDLKLVVMGATLEAEKFQGYFKGAPLMRVPDWLHPVQILYNAQEPERDYLEEAITMAVQIHFFEGPGDVLVFLTDQEEIEDACRKIRKTISEMGSGYVGPATVLPLYPALLLDMRHAVFEPAPPPLIEGAPAGRKIVVSTDIAATYLTIGGIGYVVDSGFAKLKVYNPLTQVESQVAHRISKASAHQRSNCAGKTQPGKCFRLYTERCFNQDLQLQSCPEILRSNLADTFLTLQKLETDDMVHFNFMDPPSLDALLQALELLNYLLVLDDDVKLTKFGEILSEFPLDPQMGVTLLASRLFNCSNEILSISAMLSVPNCFVFPWEPQEIPDEAKARFGHIDGDHLMLLNVYNAYKQNNEDPSWCYGNFVNYDVLKAVDNVRQQLVRIMTRFNLKLRSTDINSPDYYVNIRKAMLVGYFMQVAHLDKDGHYRTVNDNQVVQLHPSTCLKRRPEWVIYSKHVLTNTNYIHTLTDICGEWLVEIAPHYYDLGNLKNSEAKEALKKLCENREREKVDSQNREAEKEGSDNKLYGNLAPEDDVDTVNKQMQDTNQRENEMKLYQEWVVHLIKQICIKDREFVSLRQQVHEHEKQAKAKEESCSVLEEKLNRAKEEMDIMRRKVTEQHQQHNEEMECQEQFYKEKLEAKDVVEDLVNRIRSLVSVSPLPK